MKRNYKAKTCTDSKWHPAQLALAPELSLENCLLSKADPVHEGSS